MSVLSLGAMGDLSAVEIKASSFFLSVGFKNSGTFIHVFEIATNSKVRIAKSEAAVKSFTDFYPNVFLLNVPVHYMLFPADLPFRKVTATGNAHPGGESGPTIAHLLHT